VAGFGPGGWAQNARAAGRVTLSRGRTTEAFTATERGPAEAALTLERYLAEHPRTVGACFDVGQGRRAGGLRSRTPPASGVPPPPTDC
jgi:hypothetical protein